MKTEKKYRILFETARDAIFTLDKDQFIDCNPATLEMFRCSREDIINQSLNRFSTDFQPDGQPSKEKAIKKINAARRGREQHFEWKAIRLDGTPLDVEIKLNRFKLGNRNYLQAIVRDITIQKDTQARLKESEQQYRTVVETMNEGLLLVDTKSRILQANQRFCKMTGYTQEELKGKVAHQLLIKDRTQKKRVRNAIQKRLKGKSAQYELEVTCKNGTRIWTLLSASPYYDKAGRVIGSLGIVMDITDRKKAVATLKDSEQKFKALTEEALAGVYLIQDNIFKYVNPIFCKVFGYQPRELIEKLGPLDLTHPKDQKEGKTNMDASLSQKRKSVRYTFTGVKKNGKTIRVETYGTVIQYRGKPAIIGTLLDISQREQAEAELRKQEVLKASEHQFRNIFDNVRLFAVSIDKNGYITYINSYALAITGWTHKEVIGKNWFKIFVPKKTSNKRHQVFRKVMQGKQSLGRFKQNSVLTKDGKVRILNWSNTLQHNDKGRPVGLSGIGEDVTDARTARQTIEKLFDITLNLLVIMDMEGNFRKVNPAFQNLLDYSMHELENTSWMDIVYPSDRSEATRTLKKIQAGQTVSQFKVRIKTSQGGFKWMLWQCIPDIDAGLIYGSATDITNIQQTEQQLQKSQEAFKLLFDRAAIGIAKVGLDGRFIEVNPKLCEYTGYSKAEMQKMTFSDITHPDDIKQSLSYKEDLIRHKLDHFNTQKRYIRKDGKVITIRLTVNIVRNKSGKPLHFVSAFEDVTRQKQSEEKLRQSHSLLKATFESTEAGILAVDRSGKIISYNQKFLTLWGIPKSVPRHKKDKELIKYVSDQLKAPKAFSKRISEIYNKPEASSSDIIKLKDGRVFDRYSKPQVLDGKIIGRVWNFRDITSRHRTEQALRHSESNLKAIFDSSVQGYLLIDRDTSIRAMNKSAGRLHKKIFGQQLQQGEPLAKYTHHLQEAHAAFLYENFLHALQGKTCREARYIDEHWFEFTFTPVHEEEQIVGVCLGILDIQDRKQAEEALRQSEKRYRSLVHNTSDLILVLDQHNRIRYANPSLKRILGYNQSQWTGKKLNAFVHPEDAESIRVLLRTLQKQKKIETPIDFRMCSKDDVWRYLEVIGNNLLDDPAVKGIILNARETTERKHAEQALKENEERYRTLVSNIPGIIYRCSCDPDWTMHFISQNIEVLTGYRPSDLEHNNKLSYARIIHPDDRQRVEQKIDQHVRKEEPFELEYRLIDASGNIKWVYKKGQGVYNQQNELLYLDGAIFDITEQKRSEQFKEVTYNIASKANQVTDLQHLLQFIHYELGTVINTRNFYVVLYDHNKQTLSFPYYVDEHFKGEHMKSIPPRKMQGGLTEYLLKEGKPMLLSKTDLRKLATNKEIKVKGKVPRIWLGVPLKEKQTVTGAIVLQNYKDPKAYSDDDLSLMEFIANQIATLIIRKQKDMKLKRSEEKFRGIFTSIQEIFVNSALDGRIEMISPAVKGILGYEPEELIGKNISTLYAHPEDRQKLMKTLFERGICKNFETTFKKKDGTRINVQSNPYFVYDENGKPAGVDGIIIDITKRKKAEKELRKAKHLAEEATRTKSQFIANISHELKTPLNGITGMVDLARETPLTKEQQEYLQTIKHSSQTLSHLINDLLELSKIDAREMRLTPDYFHLKSLLDNIIHTFSTKASARKNDLFYKLSARVPDHIYADKLRVNQVLNNLVDNAIKFTRQGKVKISVAAEKVKGSNDYLLTFKVEDTGIGIAPKNKKKLFKRFSQVDASLKRKYEGTGLGLAISQELIQLMNGKIGVEGASGQGSTFWFTITAPGKNTAQKKIPSAIARSKTKSGQVPDTSPVRILLVEDNPINQKVTKKMLQKLDAQVEVAHNGHAGIHKVQQYPYDLVFLDIQMPDMDGITAIKKIKDNSHAPLPPIIVLTAKTLEQKDQKLLRELGIRDLLQKPLELSTLRKVLQKKVKYRKSAPTHNGSHARRTAKTLYHRLNHLKELLGNNWPHMLEDFLQNTSKHLKVAKKAFAKSDFERMQRHLHDISGVSSTLTFNELAEVAKAAETYIRENITGKKATQTTSQKANHAFLSHKLHYLESEFISLQSALKKVLDQEAGKTSG